MTEQATVVVGVDGSPEARAALGYALDDAARRGARVRVVTVSPAPDYWAIAYGMSMPSPTGEGDGGPEKAARHMVDEVRRARRAAADVPVDVVALVGQPAAVLIEQARDADLLVLGNRGLGGFASALLGSVGLQCVMHASGPVTIVRPPQEPGANAR